MDTRRNNSDNVSIAGKSTAGAGLKKSWSRMRSFFRVFRPPWALAVYAGLGTILVALLQLPAPFMVQYLADVALPGGNTGQVYLFSGVLLGLLVLGWGLALLNRYTLARFRENLHLQVRHSLFRHVLSLPVSFFKKHDAGDIFSRLQMDTRATGGIFADNMLTAVSSFFTFITGLGALFYLHWKLALAVLAVLPFYIFADKLAGNRIGRCEPRTRENRAKTGRYLRESFLGIITVKLFAGEKRRVDKFAQLARKNRRDNMETAVLGSLKGSLARLAGGVVCLAILCLGLLETIQGRLTIGKLVAFHMFLFYLYGPLSNLPALSAGIHRAAAAMSRILEITRISPEFDRDRIPPAAPPFKGEITFCGAGFSYGGGKMALEDISFIARPGETIAVVGKSGAGKTTLANLIPRIHDTTSGQIWIDGYDLDEFPKERLRNLVGCIPRDTYLFDGTIMDNIRFAGEGATVEEVRCAARVSGLEKILESLSLDLNTPVGALEGKLSRGQKQFISIARVFLRSPKIIIFEEVDTDIDYKTGCLLKQAMEQLTRGRTAFIIAHRLTTAFGADKILVLEEGKLVEVGTHDTLSRKKGAYRELFAHRFPGVPVEKRFNNEETTKQLALHG